ncbi:MAG: EamA family transporter [Anaerolineaceae bacterium]|nr:EamA family transporter [Anaerolineaceae bacterium]
MTIIAFVLVLVSASLHATWNFLSKRAGGDTAFVWLFSLLATIIYLPLAIAIIVIQKPQLGAPELTALAITCLLHIAYYLFLNWGYQVGDLSLVYPIARGAGPLLASIGAIILLGERPSPLALGGMLLISVGIVILTGGTSKTHHGSIRMGIIYGLLTAVAIGAYTLQDKQVVGFYLVPPLILTWASNFVRLVVLAPHALRHWNRVKFNWQTYKREAFSVGVLDSLSYILFLIALSSGLVTQLSPLRQTSILMGAFLGTRLLSEEGGRRRMMAALVMMIGVIVLAVG